MTRGQSCNVSWTGIVLSVFRWAQETCPHVLSHWYRDCLRTQKNGKSDALFSGFLINITRSSPLREERVVCITEMKLKHLMMQFWHSSFLIYQWVCSLETWYSTINFWIISPQQEAAYHRYFVRIRFHIKKIVFRHTFPAKKDWLQCQPDGANARTT